MPRTSARPIDDPTERTTDFIAASATVWRPELRPPLPVPKPGMVQPESLSDCGAGCCWACFCCSAALANSAAFFCSSSNANSRSIVLSYWPATGLCAITCWRSCGVIGPSRDAGGRISVRWTIAGMPFSSSVETSASPTLSCVMALAQSKSGFGRKVSAAVRTAFCSRGV